MLVFAVPEADGRLRFAVVSGPAPLAQAIDDSGIRIHAAGPSHFSDGLVGGLAINLGEARRVRLNGALRPDADGALLTIKEAFTSCRKYLVRSSGFERHRRSEEPAFVGARRPLDHERACGCRDFLSREHVS